MGEGEETTTTLAPIASPLAGKKLTKRALKLVKTGRPINYFLNLFSASSEKAVKRGVKEVVKALRKGEKGLCIIAGDISPIDVITHLPILCEDNDVPYVYVSSKEALGTASQTKRPTSCVLITLKADSELTKTFNKVVEEVKEITPAFN
jgi:H/ACA ribonucleoprotein complex subunit 2